VKKSVVEDFDILYQAYFKQQGGYVFN